MKSWITFLGMVILAVSAIGMSSKPRGMMVVSDQEAATLYGGCVDADPKNLTKCGETGGGNCTVTSGASQLIANGSGKEQSVNCGASACGTVTLTSCTCNG